MWGWGWIPAPIWKHCQFKISILLFEWHCSQAGNQQSQAVDGVTGTPCCCSYTLPSTCSGLLPCPLLLTPMTGKIKYIQTQNSFADLTEVHKNLLLYWHQFSEMIKREREREIRVVIILSLLIIIWQNNYFWPFGFWRYINSRNRLIL